MSDGDRLFDLARQHVGERYVNVLVPKDNPDWRGPWDCAEFASWLVFQTSGRLFGCTDDAGNPATTEAYTGAWASDARRLGKMVSPDEAARTRGAFLLRFPPAPGSMGHIVVSDGAGGTVEAMGTAYGVRTGKVAGRAWDTGVLIPWFGYGPVSGVTIKPKPFIVYRKGAPGMDPVVIRRIQSALHDQGYDPGPIDGEFGDWTTAAVAAFQAAKGLVVDGQVGRQTAGRLKIELT